MLPMEVHRNSLTRRAMFTLLLQSFFPFSFWIIRKRLDYKNRLGTRVGATRMCISLFLEQLPIINKHASLVFLFFVVIIFIFQGNREGHRGRRGIGCPSELAAAQTLWKRRFQRVNFVHHATYARKGSTGSGRCQREHRLENYDYVSRRSEGLPMRRVFSIYFYFIFIAKSLSILMRVSLLFLRDNRPPT